MKKCAYCGEILGSPFHFKTDEHIIPDSLLKLYPEQDISIHNKSRFVDSGFYIFKQNDWKLIVDAGQPGPAYIPGHAHCDTMSFELFRAGKPVIVNCGTYAYQCKERSFLCF